MDTRPRTHQESKSRESRGSGPGVRKRRSDALGPRKDIIVRLPEKVAHRLKVVAVHQRMTVQDFCEQAIVPQIQKAMDELGLTAQQIDNELSNYLFIK